MKTQDINKTIDKLKDNNKNRIEFIIFLLVLIVVLYLFLYIINIPIHIKKYLPILITILEIIFLIFNILIIITNNKLRNLINKRKEYFEKKIMSTEDDININNIVYKKDKSLSLEDIDRVDIFSKEERIIYTNNLIQGKYKDIKFKSYNIEIKDNKKIYKGKWIELNTDIKENISIYISDKDKYINNLIYPKKLFKEIKSKNKKIFVKNNVSVVEYLIELQKELNENIYISIVNDKLQILIFKNNRSNNIEKEIKKILDYLEIIYKYKDKLVIQ